MEQKTTYGPDELLNKYRAYMAQTNVAPEYIDWGFYFSILSAGTGKYGIGAIYENDINPIIPENKGKNKLVLKTDTMELNMFIMIVGDSGSGKTNAIKHLPKLIKRSNKYISRLTTEQQQSGKIILLPEDMTPEAMVKHLAHECVQEVKWRYYSNEKNGLIVPVTRQVSIGTLVSNEMGSCYGNRNDDISGVFNQVFDGGSFSARRISRSPINVEHSCVSLIGAATPQWFGRITKTTSADEGLLSRFVILNGEPQPDPYFHGRKEEDDKVFEELSRWMNYIAMQGKMLYVTKDVADRVEALHIKEFHEYKNTNPHLREYFKRRKRHHWPLAMVLKLSENPKTPFVDYSYFERANEVLRKIEHRMAIPFMDALRDIIDKVRIEVIKHLQGRLISEKKATLNLTSGELFNIITQYTDGRNAREVKDILISAQIISPLKGFLIGGKAIEAYKIDLTCLNVALKNSLSSTAHLQ